MAKKHGGKGAGRVRRTTALDLAIRRVGRLQTKLRQLEAKGVQVLVQTATKRGDA